MDNVAVWKGNTVSVNRWHGVTDKWVVKNGRRQRISVIYKTTEYRQFVRSLATAFKQQLTPVEGYVHVDILMFLDPSKDTDGSFKPFFDALETAKVIKNDRLNHRGTYDRYDDTSGIDTIIVSIKPLVRNQEDYETASLAKELANGCDSKPSISI